MIGVVRPTPLSLLPGRLVRGCRLDRSPSGPGRDPVFTDSPQRPRGPLHTAVRTSLRIRVNTGQCVALSTRGRSRGRRLTPRLWRRAAFRKRPTQPGARGPSRSPRAPPRPAPLGCPRGDTLPLCATRYSCKLACVGALGSPRAQRRPPTWRLRAARPCAPLPPRQTAGVIRSGL